VHSAVATIANVSARTMAWARYKTMMDVVVEIFKRTWKIFEY
jgi:hypothetical protein